MRESFLDRSVKPDDRMLARALGRSFACWKEIENGLEAAYGPLTEEWKYYGASSGWTLKLLRKKRNLFFLGPRQKYFSVGFVFGDEAVKAVEKSDLPVRIIRELKKARKYAEGRGLRIEVKKKADVRTVLELVAIKVNN